MAPLAELRAAAENNTATKIPELFNKVAATIAAPPSMSLFGNLGGSGQPVSSGAGLGSAPATSGSGAPSLFGGAAASTGASTGGLFSGLGGAKSSAPLGTSQPASSGGLGGGAAGGGGGLFQNLGAGTSQPASTGASTGGLFSLGGGLGATSSAPAASSAPSLLSTTSTSQAPAPTSASSQFPSMFAKPGTSQAPAQSTAANPFGSTQQTTVPAQSSLFSSSTAPQQPEGPLSQSNNTGGRSSHFDHLLERSRKRNAGENGTAGFDNLPSLQLGLGDIARKVRNLGTGGPSARSQDRAS
jgi:nuclear pore complex protein Nup93